MDSTLKNTILKYFYVYHEKPSIIAKKFNVSKPYVTKVILKNSNYIDEKEFRSNISKIKRMNYRALYNANRQKSNKELADIIKSQHTKASIELSWEIAHHIADK